MASYVPLGKDVKEWTTIPQPPTHTPRAPYPKSSSGTVRDFDRPWNGDREATPGTMSRVASTLQSNIGNYLLFRAVQPQPQQQQGLQQVHADDLTAKEQAAVGNAARSMLGGPPPGGGKPGGPPGLGKAPFPMGPAGGATSTGPIGPAELGPGPKGLGPGPLAVNNSLLNEEEMGQSSLFAREPFNSAIPMPPRKEDRRPKGRSQRGKDRFPQQSFDI